MKRAKGERGGRQPLHIKLSRNDSQRLIMDRYRFVLILKDLDYMSEETAEALYEAGCSDCTASSRDGVARVKFARDAETLHNAIASAVADVGRAGCAVSRIEIDADDFALQTA